MNSINKSSDVNFLLAILYYLFVISQFTLLEWQRWGSWSYNGPYRRPVSCVSLC